MALLSPKGVTVQRFEDTLDQPRQLFEGVPCSGQLGDLGRAGSSLCGSSPWKLARARRSSLPWRTRLFKTRWPSLQKRARRLRRPPNSRPLPQRRSARSEGWPDDLPSERGGADDLFHGRQRPPCGGRPAQVHYHLRGPRFGEVGLKSDRWAHTAHTATDPSAKQYSSDKFKGKKDCNDHERY